MPVDFTAIDFETANSSSASACSVGLVKVRDGRVVETDGWLIRPPAGHDHFVEWNVRIHGIMQADVVDAPLWSEQLPRLIAFAGDDMMVAHNAGFDMGVIKAACAASFLPHPAIDYVCSLQVARKSYDLDSYRLPSAAAAAGFDDFRHHDAIADSEACAAIMIDAARRWGADDLRALAAAAGVRVSSTAPKPSGVGASAPSRSAATQRPAPTAASFTAGGWAPPPLSV
ncbi:exonuclease domain-containing protein [Schumannella sp. 10F1B-5-1]|uniref:exonuclease domain-containing protein n=1 Tax=Schumannella sp. 10F1B-5-1 TaxID=2590780 RepID=UPI0011308E1D|nr:exonuclease domain-containing protein [Schumannella sp. 10F1B-5-1]TPW73097.1 DNA polymerase III subunit epsilon [Schumannella sp. 10F1B-5-1]